jgi:phosphoribosylformylglycinamidine (FGAM) synthase PurS component
VSASEGLIRLWKNETLELGGEVSIGPEKVKFCELGLDKEDKVVNIVTENSRKLIWNPVLGTVESCDYQSHSEIIQSLTK